ATPDGKSRKRKKKTQEFLGEGAFGKVAKCSKLGSQEMYAIKIITHVEEGMEEFESMKLIKALDPDENHLIKMYECFSFQNMICLVFEILEESLEDFLNKNKCKATPLTYVRAIAQQMFQALQALKSIGVVHLNPFRAPEVILGLPLDESVDMWALGMVLACVYRGNYIFPPKSEYETIRYKETFFTMDNGHWRLCTPEEYTEATGEKVRNKNHVINFDAMIDQHRDTYEMHDRILEVNPQRRITPSQALEHDFITMKHLSEKRCYQDEVVVAHTQLGRKKKLKKTSPVMKKVLEKSSSHKCFRRVLKFFRELLP
uniref:Protein kinase domain-containing protein n=1 Tax=Oryzias latipes TaxID=8090 RepID=A0A3P9LC65_ORYLA